MRTQRMRQIEPEGELVPGERRPKAWPLPTVAQASYAQSLEIPASDVPVGLDPPKYIPDHLHKPLFRGDELSTQRPFEPFLKSDRSDRGFDLLEIGLHRDRAPAGPHRLDPHHRAHRRVGVFAQNDLRARAVRFPAFVHEIEFDSVELAPVELDDVLRAVRMALDAAHATGVVERLALLSHRRVKVAEEYQGVCIAWGCLHLRSVSGGGYPAGRHSQAKLTPSLFPD